MPLITAEHKQAPPPVQATKPRLGFAGLGWIGLRRLKALLEEGCAAAAAVADPVAEHTEAAAGLAPEAARHRCLDDLLGEDLDGIVLATPSGLHAEQSLRALDAGFPVFCQKPLGRSAAETRRAIAAARRADGLLGVDLSYRFTEAMQTIHRRIQAGTIGTVYAADLTFHNAYGPDKDWFYDPARAGGGCVMDLGIHLVDLALWALDFPNVEAVTSRLFAQGRPLTDPENQVEDYATARLDFAGGATARLTCSWNLPAGRDAVIEAAFYGTEGGLAMRNRDGSFYDFIAERFDGAARETLTEPPDAWGGRALVAWAEQLADDSTYDSSIETLLPVAETLDAIYQHS